MHDSRPQSMLRECRNRAAASPFLSLILSLSSAISVGCSDSLPEAAAKGDADKVSKLIANGQAVNVIDKDGRTALWQAAWNGKEDIVILLLQHNATVDIEDKYIGGALHAAASRGRTKIVSLLLDHGASINRICHPRQDSALWLATRDVHVDTVRLLIDRGADIDQQNSAGTSPLGIASIVGSLELCKVLISAGANVNIKDNEGNTPAHRAIMCKEPIVLQYLIEKGADTRITNNHGETIMDMARRMKNIECIEIIRHHTK